MKRALLLLLTINSFLMLLAQDGVYNDIMVWGYDLKHDKSESWMTRSGIVIYNNLLGEVGGIDLVTGKHVWKSTLDGNTRCELTADEWLIVQITNTLNNTVQMRVIEANTGAELWKNELQVTVKLGKKENDQQFIVLPQNKKIIMRNNHANYLEYYCYDLSDGRTWWSKKVALDSYFILKDQLTLLGQNTDRNDFLLLKRLIADDGLILSKVDLHPGSAIWEQKFFGRKLSNNPMLLINDSLLIIDFTDDFVYLNNNSGKIMWSFKDVENKLNNKRFYLFTHEVNGLRSHEPLLRHNVLYTTSGAIDINNGKVIWRYAHNNVGLIFYSLTTNYGLLNVYITTYTPGGNLGVIPLLILYNAGYFDKIRFGKIEMELFDPITGKSRWKEPVKLNKLSEPIIDGDSIYVFTKDGLASIALKSGLFQRLIGNKDTSNLKSNYVELKKISDNEIYLQGPTEFIKMDLNGQINYALIYKPPVGFDNVATDVRVFGQEQEEIKVIQSITTDFIGLKGIVILDTVAGKEIGTLRRDDRSPTYLIHIGHKMAAAISKEGIMKGFKIIRP